MAIEYIFLYLDYVEVNNGYVSICKEAILGNCSKNECKFIIYVLKNFNGKFSISIIIKVGVRTLIILLQQQLAHISHLFFSFHLSFSLSKPTYNKYVSRFVFLHTYINTHIWSFFFTHTTHKTCIFSSPLFSPLLLFLMFMISIFFSCLFVRLSVVSSL